MQLVDVDLHDVRVCGFFIGHLHALVGCWFSWCWLHLFALIFTFVGVLDMTLFFWWSGAEFITKVAHGSRGFPRRVEMLLRRGTHSGSRRICVQHYVLARSQECHRRQQRHHKFEWTEHDGECAQRVCILCAIISVCASIVGGPRTNHALRMASLPLWMRQRSLLSSCGRTAARC